MLSTTRVDSAPRVLETVADEGDDPDPSRSRPDPAPSALEIDLIDATGRLPGDDGAWLRARLADAVRELGASGEARVRVVDDVEMADAHERYAGVPGTTDVLTFDLADGASAREPDPGPLDVDLLVCLDEAARQAGGRGHGEARRELLLYALHGVLHCLGEDDHTDEGFRRMHAREDAVLRAIGVGPVFHADDDREPGAGGDR